MHRVGRRRSRALFSNTCQQRTCLNSSYKNAHESYNIDRWTPSLRATLRLIHRRITTSRLEHEPLLRILSRTLRPSRHPSSSKNGSRRRHRILSLSTSKTLSTGTVEGRYWNLIRGLSSSSLHRSWTILSAVCKTRSLLCGVSGCTNFATTTRHQIQEGNLSCACLARFTRISLDLWKAQ